MASPPVSDPRNIDNGIRIPLYDHQYCDQPYLVKTDDGAWICAVTAGLGREGESGQHVITMRSTDHGRTWDKPVDVEPVDGVEASYAVLLKTPGGRLYCFYNHNTDNVREVKREDGGVFHRVDSLGHFVFKYSDDHGRTWSAKRYPIDVREFEVDRNNSYDGKIRFFWNVGRPLLLEDAAIVPLHKVGAMGEGFFAQSEGAFLRSENILTESDPEKIVFETLPDGEIGLRTPPGGGRIAEEQSITSLSDGSLYCVYRTVDGWPACSYSRDGGHTWSQPQYVTYRPSGRRIKNPRAANFVWRCDNGRFLYWFHNHGGRFIQEFKSAYLSYEDRNPVWLSGGVETDGPDGKIIVWSEPEIALYDDDTYIRMSYPDLMEDDGRFFVTETQKETARVHELDRSLLEGMWATAGRDDGEGQAAVAEQGLLLALPNGSALPDEVEMPTLPDFIRRDTERGDYGTKALRRGFSLDLWIQFDSLAPHQVILDSRTNAGRGLALELGARQTLELILNDGRSESRWDCDPDILEPGKPHHVTIIVDGGPGIILFVVDGAVCDGGDARQFGWGRFSPNLRHVQGEPTLRIAPRLRGRVESLRIYDRALRVSEAVGNFRAGRYEPVEATVG